MVEEIWVALAAPTIASCGAIVVALLSAAKQSRAIQEVHLSVNSRLDQALRETARRARLEGLAEGNEALKALTAEVAHLKQIIERQTRPAE